jgi:hypothetical protein
MVTVNFLFLLPKIEKSKVGELKKWLQERGVKNLSKKKKNDLVSMVALYAKSAGCIYP